MRLFKLNTAIILFAVMIFVSCDLDRLPTDGIPPETALVSEQGIEDVTRGSYAELVRRTAGTNNLVMMMYQSGDYRSDDLMISGTTSNRMMLTYNYLHNPDMPNTLALFRQGYQIIYNSNTVIDAVSPGESQRLDQLLGENKFIRSLLHLYIAKGFARPYSHGRDNLGIPIMREADVDARPSRASVGETYDFLVEDLTDAYTLMNEARTSSFGSAEAAKALLSRIYLYMEENELAIEYADEVINSGRYTLATTEEYPTYFQEPNNENRSEDIFAIHHRPSDDHGASMGVGSMIYESPGGAGWGENYASKALRDLLDKWPEDVRSEFIQGQYILDEDGNKQYDEDGNVLIRDRGGFPRYYVLKFVGPPGQETLSSPHFIRLTEMYLNKAEALAKLDQDQDALDIVNMLRERAGLPEEAMYSLGDLGDHNNVLDVVLEERRLELFFEGHRAHDLFRNQKDLFRDYPGTHLAPGNPGVQIDPDHPAGGTQHIPWEHNRIVWYIPEDEIELNSNLQQNPN